MMTLFTLSTILHSCVARRSCCRFPISGSMTKWSRISGEQADNISFSHFFRLGLKCRNVPLLPVCMQSTPNLEFFSFTCLDLIEASVSMGLRPEFSASAMGIESSASANALIAYCSSPGLCVNECQILSPLLLRDSGMRGQGRTLTAASSTANEQAISAAPPP